MSFRAGVLVVAVTMIVASGYSAASGSVNGGATWSAPVQVQPNGLPSSLYGVSCPTTTFCAAVDESGFALFWHAGKWSRPQSVGAGGTLTSVSCPTNTRCFAISLSGNAAIYNRQSWSHPSPVGPAGTYRLSCPSVTFCAAVGASGTAGASSTLATFDGRSWSTQQVPGSGAHNDRLLDVSCASPKFCMAVNLDGHALTFNGQRWSNTTGTGPKGMTSVSCTSKSFCLAVTDAGAYVTFDGKRWSAPRDIPGFGAAFAYSISCSSTMRCTVIGLSGMTVNWEGGHWSKPDRVFPGIDSATVAISCAPPDTCMAVNSNGTASVS